MIIVPSPSYKPPGVLQINPRHPWAPYVLVAYFFNEGNALGKSIRDASPNANHGLTSGAVTRQAGTYGQEVSFGATQWIDVPGRPLFSTGVASTTDRGQPITVLARIKSTAAGGNQVIASRNFTSGLGLDWALTLSSNGITTNAGGMAAYAGGAWKGSQVTTDVANDGKYHVIGGTMDRSNIPGVTDANLCYYVDGRLDKQTLLTSFGNNVLSPGRYTNGITVGTYNQTAANCLKGSMEFFLLLRGIALSPPAMFALSMNPYALIAPQRRAYAVGIAAASGGGSRMYIIST